MKVVGVETKHAGQVFNGTRKEIDDLMIDHGYSNYGTKGFDTFYTK